MRARLLWLVLVAVLAWPTAAGADTLRVTNDSDDPDLEGSLGWTIAEAGEGDTIEVPPGDYPLTNGDVLVAQGNVIEGAGKSETTITPTGGGDAVIDGVNVVDATVGPAENATGDGDGSKIETKAQIIALAVTLALLLLVLELVRRRRLAERYALLWMFAAVALLVLSIWTDGLDVIADAMGIQEPANAIYILAFGLVFFLLLHFSVAISRLAEENKILAQENARLDFELRQARGEVPGQNGNRASAEQPEHEPPVGTQDSG